MPIGCWITSQRGLAPGVDSYRMGPDLGADAVAPGEELGCCDGVVEVVIEEGIGGIG